MVPEVTSPPTVKLKAEAEGNNRDAALRYETLPSVSVVMPALNEAENLQHVFSAMPQMVTEVVLVDGKSIDGTIEAARRVWPNIHIVDVERRRRAPSLGTVANDRRGSGKTLRLVNQAGKGKGAALRCGCKSATGDIIVMLDADGSTDPREIPRFVGTLLAGADFAKGSRFLNGGGTADMPLYRKVGNFALVMLTNFLFGTRYTDITYGYNAIWRSHVDDLALELSGWENEIITNTRVARAGLRVKEVPSFEYKRMAGVGKLETFSAGWTILKAILWERVKRAEKPRCTIVHPECLRCTAFQGESHVINDNLSRIESSIRPNLERTG